MIYLIVVEHKSLKKADALIVRRDADKAMSSQFYTVQTNKQACEICGEKKPGCRVVWQKFGWFRGDDEAVGVTCKKDISAFAKKHNIKEYL